jgi:DNA-binding NtrC family response regulator
MKNKNILVVDDDKIILDSLCEFLNVEGFRTNGAQTLKDAQQNLRQHDYDLAITDVNLPDGDGLELLKNIITDYPQTVVVVITGYGTIESAVKAIKLGAYDYLTKPVVDDDLRLTVDRALQQQSLLTENRRLRLQLQHKYIFELIEAVADTNTTILMAGPSGTGKTMLARAIHHRSSRCNEPFIEVSCGALPETLLESELFGHVKGSFTGAVTNKQGKFLAAHRGTIFLDEVSNASPSLQIKLLRVLEDRQFEPVGSNETKTVDTRIILASNRNLENEVKKGRFREDLFYRINIVTIDLPPLRDRIGDIPLLAQHFLKSYCAQHNKNKLGFSPEAIEHLERYPWPGNIRELENTIERAVLLGRSEHIIPEDLPSQIRANHPINQPNTAKSLKQARAEPEKQIIRAALEANNYNRKATAKALQINRTTLYKKMKRYGLDKEARQIGLR